MIQRHWMGRAAVAIALTVPLAACQPPQSGSLVNAGQAQVAQRVNLGTVVSVRQVAVQGGNPTGEFAGTVGGGVVGGLIGDQIGGGSGRDLARIAGVAAGAAAGNRAAGRATTVQSLEWTVRLDNGQIVSVIQSEPTFAQGQRVQVIQGAGGFTRLAPV